MTVETRTIATSEGPTYWASLDGQHWLPFTRPATEADEAAVREAFAGRPDFKPLTFHTRYLDHLARGGK